jgi:hypothetical protein
MRRRLPAHDEYDNQRWTHFLAGGVASWDQRDLAITATLRRLREEGQRLGLDVTLPAFESAQPLPVGEPAAVHRRHLERQPF